MRLIILLFTMIIFIFCQRSYCESEESVTSLEVNIENGIIIHESVALIIRPILDGHYKYSIGEYNYHTLENKVNYLLYSLIENENADTDEALVVLTCFYIGESQEERDEIISRGTRMLTYLEKYRNKKPIIPDRNYPDYMRRDNYGFEGITIAIGLICERDFIVDITIFCSGKKFEFPPFEWMGTISPRQVQIDDPRPRCVYETTGLLENYPIYEIFVA